MPTLVPFDEKHLPALAPLQPPEQGSASLRRDLTDFARGRGAQVVVALEDGEPRGVAGWVSFGVETEGIVYGAPVLAVTESVAKALLGHLADRARALGARQLRVSCRGTETAKAAGLRTLGFAPLLDMIGMERSSHDLPRLGMPEHLRSVPLAEADWDRLAKVFNEVFSGVPNTPPLTAELARQEWEQLDFQASQLWRDDRGNYLAWLGVTAEGYVDQVGVAESLRGRGVATALYRSAAENLAARGVDRLHTLLASTNAATLRLHEKLGFLECSRRTVFALELEALNGKERPTR